MQFEARRPIENYGGLVAVRLHWECCLDHLGCCLKDASPSAWSINERDATFSQASFMVQFLLPA